VFLCSYKTIVSTNEFYPLNIKEIPENIARIAGYRGQFSPRWRNAQYFPWQTTLHKVLMENTMSLHLVSLTSYMCENH